MDVSDIDDPDSRMAELESRIAELPRGTISTKTINGKERHYHQWYEGGKTRSRYVRESELDDLRARIEERRVCESELKSIREWIDGTIDIRGCRTAVVVGTDLLAMARDSADLPRRDCSRILDEYLHGSDDRVCILYGLRRTGKTTMIHQAIMDMGADELARTAYIALTDRNTVRDLYLDIQKLMGDGYNVFFIDEATLARDFINSVGIIPLVFAAQGARLVMSGTDSLGFWLAGEDVLYGHAVLIHTTSIPYREHSRLLGIDDIDDYIRYGGTLREGMLDLDSPIPYIDEMPFGDAESMYRYCDRAIASNIQNALIRYEDSGHLVPLLELYRAHALTDVINRVVDDVSHRFVLDILDREYRPSALDDAVRNLSQDGREVLRDGLLLEIDLDSVVSRMRALFDITDAGDRRVEVSEWHLALIRRYLTVLDVIAPYHVVQFSVPGGPVREYDEMLVTQPGMRYCHARALAELICSSPEFEVVSESRREAIIERLLDGARGRILEEVVLHETAVAARDLQVTKVLFESGEFDMLVRSPSTDTCVVCEVKHSLNRTPHQRRHLVDADKCSMVEERFGRIVGRYVLYRGEDAEEDGVTYLNVEEYLRNLPESAHLLLRP